LKHHPIRCGLLRYELELQLHYRATAIERLGADVLYLGWLYVIGTRVLHSDAPRWPDMEYVFHGQGERLFYGESPKTLQKASTKMHLGRGYSIVNLANNGHNNDHQRDAKLLRRIEDPSALGALFIHRYFEEPKTTADAHQWVSRLVNLMCKPESQKILDRQENLPKGTYETSEFLRSVELQRKPLALLEQLRHWLLADENDLHFDWFGMNAICTNIWNTLIPVLKNHPIFKKQKSLLSWPDEIVTRLLDSSIVAEKVGLTSPVVELTWKIIQDAIHSPLSKDDGKKSWVADARMVKLLDSSNPSMMLMNPGPASFMRLYENWTEDDKKNSRVGRAVWNAMQAVQAVSKEEVERHTEVEARSEDEDGQDEDGVDEDGVDEDGVDEDGVDEDGVDEDGVDEDGEDEDGDDADDAPANDADNEHNDADAIDDNAFSATEYSIDLNALARGSSSNIIFMGSKMSQPVSLSRDQVSQLRTAPNGDFVMPGRAPRGASRVKMLAPRTRKGARAIVTTDDVPELNCACGLS
jgi:hypothetical protein